MAEDRSPWARPDTSVEVPAAQPAASSGGAEPAPLPSLRRARAASGTDLPSGGVRTASSPSVSVAVLPRSRGGAVTRTTDQPAPDVIQFGAEDDDPVKRNRILLRWFG